MVRACLGEPHMQNTPCRDILKPPERKDKRGPLSSVVALTVTQGGCVEHPEYIVYNQAQTLPQFAIYYKHTEECRCTHCWREVEYLNIRTVTQHGSEIFFKLKITTPFQKLMHAYCSRQGVSMSAVRFIFDGTDINETQTPAQLDMEDGDVIHVEVRQAASSSSAELMTLRVIDEDGAEVYFTLKPTTPLKKLMHVYCNRKGVPLSNMRFLLDGQRIDEAKTPGEMGMEDGEVIDAEIVT